MSVAILKEIVVTEKQAERIETDAQQNAKDIVAAAKKEAFALIEKASEEAEADAKKIISLAENKAANDIIEINEKIQIQCNKIRDNANSKLNAAVDLILGRIVKKQ